MEQGFAHRRAPDPEFLHQVPFRRQFRPDVQIVPASFLQRAKRVALSAAAVAVPLSLAACSPSSGATSSLTQQLQDEQNQELYENMGGAPPMDVDAGEAPDASTNANDGGDAGAPDGGDAAPDASDAAADGPEKPI